MWKILFLFSHLSPPEARGGQWMDYQCRLGLLSNSSTALASSDPEAVVTLFSCSFTFHFSVSLSYLNFAVPMVECLGRTRS